MTAIKRYEVQIDFSEKKSEHRKVVVFATADTPRDDVINIAEALMLDGFTKEYKDKIEIINSLII